MPVYKLQGEMPYEEMLTWFAYLERRPVGWRDDQRTAYLLQAQGVKDATKFFPTLKHMHADQSEKLAGSLKRSKMFRMMLGAKGGDHVGEILAQ